MRVVKEIQLRYTKGSSDKCYNISIVELKEGAYLVNFAYGRYGSRLKEGTKTKDAVSLQKAEEIFEKLALSKIKKGYADTEASLPAGTSFVAADEDEVVDDFSLTSYEEMLISKLAKAGVKKRGRLAKVDNYEISRIIYKLGEISSKKAKEYILRAYEMRANEESLFYYSVAYALGRVREKSLKPLLLELKEQMDKSASYIVNEALFLMEDEEILNEAEALLFPAPFRFEEGQEEQGLFQVKLLEEMVEDAYERSLDYYGDKEEIKALASKLDQVYLKLYMKSHVRPSLRDTFKKALHHLPINRYTFALFRRLYKVAEFRDDFEVLAALVTKLESKPMACYQMYDYYDENHTASLGCSRLYFKKRALRHLRRLGRFEPEMYVRFAKALLLSLNGYEEQFSGYTTLTYDEEYNPVYTTYDPFSSHITLFWIIYGDTKHYRLLPSKKAWKSSSEQRSQYPTAPPSKKVWQEHTDALLEILSQSEIVLVQRFAFEQIKDLNDILKRIELILLLDMLKLKYDEARDFFFGEIKERYTKNKETIIVKRSLLCTFDEAVLFALEQIEQTPALYSDASFVIEALEQVHKDEHFAHFAKLIETKDKDERKIIESIVHQFEKPVSHRSAQRSQLILESLIDVLKVEDIRALLFGDELTQGHYLAAKLIRNKRFGLQLPQDLQEKIASYDDPQMIAAAIYLLRDVPNEELADAHEFVVAFLYHDDKNVREEASTLIAERANDKAYAKRFLESMIDKSFKSTAEDVAKDVVFTFDLLKAFYLSIDKNLLYRALKAKSRLSNTLGALALEYFEAKCFSALQWAMLAKHPLKSVRERVKDLYRKDPQMIEASIKETLLIFDTPHEDMRRFAMEYFADFDFDEEQIVIVANSNYDDVQQFAKETILTRDFDKHILLEKLSEHPAQKIQAFVSDMILSGASSGDMVKLEFYFDRLFHTVNKNATAKSRALKSLKEHLGDKEVAKMCARLASHHALSMVWADKSTFVQLMCKIEELYGDIELPVEVERQIPTRGEDGV